MSALSNKRGYRALVPPIIIIGLMWVFYAIQQTYFPEIVAYGIRPRELDGLSGILASPLLHSPTDISHIINNSIPMFALSWALYYFYPKLASKVLAFMWVTTGLCVWVGAVPGTNHIGMSGVIYALAGFLFASGVVRKQVNLLAISLLVVFEYGSMIWGVFPLQDGVSWESHLFGGIVGVAFALYYRYEGGPQKKKYQWEIEEELGLDNYEYEYWKVDETTNTIMSPEEAVKQEGARPVRIKYYVTKKSDGIQDD